MAHPKEDSLLQDKVKEGHTIMRKCLPWLYANCGAWTSTTPYVVNVATTGVSWQLKKR